MSETKKDRLLKFLDCMGISRRSFEKAIGAGNAYIANMTEGPSTKVIERICKQYPQLNRVWFVTGEGEMFNGGIFNESSSTVSIDAHGNNSSNRGISMDGSDSGIIDFLKSQLSDKERFIKMLMDDKATLIEEKKSLMSRIDKLESMINQIQMPKQ